MERVSEYRFIWDIFKMSQKFWKYLEKWRTFSSGLSINQGLLDPGRSSRVRNQDYLAALKTPWLCNLKKNYTYKDFTSVRGGESSHPGTGARCIVVMQFRASSIVQNSVTQVYFVHSFGNDENDKHDLDFWFSHLRLMWFRIVCT